MLRKTKTVIQVVVLVFLSLPVLSQLEAGILFGASEYGGDLAKTPYILEETKPEGTIFGTYYMSDKISIRGSFSLAKISGQDANKETSDNRNLSFQNSIKELAFVGQYDFKDYVFDGWTPYLYAGISVFHHNPEALNAAGDWIKLQPLGTEGQGITGFGEPYNLFQVAIPFGGGLKAEIARNVVAYIDYGARKTFTDHLDDVSRQEYVDPNIFATEYATTDPQRFANLMELAYRAHEIGGRPYSDFTDPQVRKGDPRNLSRKRDMYHLIGVGASYSLPWGDRDRNPLKRNRRKVPYKHKYPKSK